MTKTMCHFCKGEAEAIKVEIEREWSDEIDDEVESEKRLPVCLPCERYWYDGTEDRPGVEPLA